MFRSRFPDTFVFRPDADRPDIGRIDCHLVSADPQVWQDVLLRRVLPKVATTFGALAVHAAAVATDDRCLLLVGQSGAGKSTLTTFLATAGWDALSDDTSIVWCDTAAVVVEPVQQGTGVWDHARHALALANADCIPMPGYDGRKWWYRPAGAPPASRPLSAMLLLDRAPDAAAPSVTQLSRQEALSILLTQNIPFLPDAPPDAASAAAFGRMAAIARRVPAFRLTYPDGYAALAAVGAWLRTVSFAGETA